MVQVGWVDSEKLAAEWADVPDDDEQFIRLLRAAHWQCLNIAPADLPDPLPEPQGSAYTEAQILQTKHLWAREKAGNGQGYGPDGYMIQTYPLVLEARQLIRPKRSPLKGLL